MKFSFSHGLRLSMLCAMLVLAGCAGKKQRVSYDRHAFDSAIKDAASEYGVDAKLI
ncbi:lytic transglycosylase, partial [Serratia marcescens]